MEQPNVNIFKALAIEQRTKIISLLCGRCLCAGALARLLNITPGAVSQHLNVLKDCGLVTAERRGYFRHYRITEGAYERAREELDALFDTSVPNRSGHCKKDCSCPKHKDNFGKK